MQLRFALVALATIPVSLASAQERDTGDGEVTSKLSVYSDNDETTVLTTAVDAEVIAPADVAVGAYALLDAVSSASIDVISAATGRWTENRVELGARAGIDIDRLTGVTLSYSNSRENDWQSHTASISGRREVANRNAVLGAAYALVTNRVGRADDPSFERGLDVHSMQLSASQLWSEDTLFAFTYNISRSSGFHASPYRFVRVGLEMAPESHPETRVRQALTARHLRALGERLSIESTYRFYLDDWGILSNTLTSALTARMASWVDVRARARLYQQTGADFYSDGYEMPLEYLSSDRELSPFVNIGGGVKAAFYAGGFIFDVKLDAIHYRFSEFERLPTRNALVSGVGARMTW